MIVRGTSKTVVCLQLDSSTTPGGHITGRFLVIYVANGTLFANAAEGEGLGKRTDGTAR